MGQTSRSKLLSESEGPAKMLLGFGNIGENDVPSSKIQVPSSFMRQPRAVVFDLDGLMFNTMLGSVLSGR